ncbi:MULTISPECIES: 4-(cytidine 5'-diphospho)-2-C-methyl-D-erythritol kinase [Acutalibacteraceae]|uniref:4-(cytidine 5'-diphospho)-2-C-methyl-D-erythritol kinase n=1 Tax=Acutalibacteraceae TaxID=3082771 RepID=UPI0013E8C2E7|nr:MULTISPECIES: 4-(cytidine 5'-diphospho)-2-C-methyl-D-erythritol kinase [Acutalibacteraceae]
MPDLVENAYAKINLTLDVTGKRPDGYHTIRSVFQSITLCDRLTLLSGPEGEIRVASDRPRLSCGRDNTVHRAAEAFFRAAGIQNPGVFLLLEKRIPWQAGLGGGSADAASALRLLNRRFSFPLSGAELSEVGLNIGADVPFCLTNGTMLAEGIGERLTRLPPLSACHILLCKPAAGIGTKEAYRALDRDGTFGDRFTEPMLGALRGGDLTEIAKYAGNVFEPLALLPEIPQIKTRMLKSGAAAACMTGTGSAVFGLFERIGQAQTCAKDLSGIYPEVFLCEPYSSC